MEQLLFLMTLLITLGVFGWSMKRLIFSFSLTHKEPIGNWAERFKVMMKVAFGQSKIFRYPLAGFFHAMVFWGFVVITLSSIEMVIDGLSGKERVMAYTGWFYNLIIASGDVMAYIVIISIIIFMSRRLFLRVRRFYGIEMKPKSKYDAIIALTLILLLMVSLAGLNMAYFRLHTGDYVGMFPLSSVFAKRIFIEYSPERLLILQKIFWWSHILLIFLFANILPYSKHFHVFTSIPNVFLSRLKPLGYLQNMPAITSEVRFMLFPETTSVPSIQEDIKYGVKDVKDVTWKNYLDSLACTECGRCTDNCPANITGKKLSPRKIFVDLRARMKEYSTGIMNDVNYNDNKTLIHNYITAEELWACTTCNACAQECPVNINHPSLILDMRRYMVMDESSAPGELNAMFSYIENNGAPWQYPSEDRLNWLNDLNK